MTKNDIAELTAAHFRGVTCPEVDEITEFAIKIYNQAVEQAVVALLLKGTEEIRALKIKM